MRLVVFALAIALSVALIGELFLIQEQAALKRNLEDTRNQLAALEQRAVQLSRLSRVGQAVGTEEIDTTIPPDESTLAIAEGYEHFVAEQRKVYSYIMAKVEYLFDTARMLETLALMSDARPDERARLQSELEGILDTRARSKEELETATAKFAALARKFVADEKRAEAAATVSVPQAEEG